jgi:hypothetical protein
MAIGLEGHITCQNRNFSKIPKGRGYDLQIEIDGVESPQVATTTTQIYPTLVGRRYAHARMRRLRTGDNRRPLPLTTPTITFREIVN